MTTKANVTTRLAPKSWLITALLASLAVAYVAFIFAPEQAEIGGLRSQLNERRQHILQASSLVLPVDSAVKQLAKTQLVSAHWKQSAPTASGISVCFAQLTSEAQSAGVSIERFDPQPANEMQALAQHGVTVHFHGQFSEVFDFIRRVEELPASVWIPVVRLNTEETSGAKVRGELNLTIFVDRNDSTD